HTRSDRDWSSDVCSSDLAFALLYQLRGGLKAVALTDIVQVTLLVLGGLVVAYLTLTQIGGGDLFGGFHKLVSTAPDHFHMILKRSEERRVGNECEQSCAE